MRGVEGDNGRVTAEAEWKKSIVTAGGMVITPLLEVRGDAGYADMSDGSVAAIDNMATTLGVAADVRSELYRYMATAGLEWRWPVLFSSTSSTHVLEPMAQVFARPDEQYIGELGIPNEDAQSFVFDAGHLVRARQILGLRPDGRRHARQSRRALLRRLRQRLDDQCASSANPTRSAA